MSTSPTSSRKKGARTFDLAPYLVLLKHGWGIYIYQKEGKMSTPEGKIKAKLNAKLKKLNYAWKFMPVPNGYGLPSLDYLLCVAGHFVAIEAKADAKKQPTPRQIQTMADIRAAGGIVFVVYDNASIDACIGAIVLLSGSPVHEPS